MQYRTSKPDQKLKTIPQTLTLPGKPNRRSCSCLLAAPSIPADVHLFPLCTQAATTSLRGACGLKMKCKIVNGSINHYSLVAEHRRYQSSAQKRRPACCATVTPVTGLCPVRAHVSHARSLSCAADANWFRVR